MVTFILGDILNEDGDHLISSGNPSLNMSGGVNGALLLKYGGTLQDELHKHLKDNVINSVNPGYCYKFKQKIGDYKSVIYSVAIDGWYESDIKMITKTISLAFSLINPARSDVVLLPALATGYGKLSKIDFGIALRKIDRITDKAMVKVVERNELGLEQIVCGYKKCA